MEKTPHQHGWVSEGRVSAFFNEDIFIRNQALAAHWDASADKGLKPYADLKSQLIKNGLESFNALADWAFRKMVELTRQGHMEPLDPKAAQTLNWLVSQGHDVVIVSNSGTDRIENLLERSQVSKKVKVRGGAKKFVLGKNIQSMPIGAFMVDVNRPHYLEIMTEERPDAVIGDVFTLDLSVPLHLCESGSSSVNPEIQLLLRTREYTPHWSKDLFLKPFTGKAKLKICERFEDVPTLLGLA